MKFFNYLTVCSSVLLLSSCQQDIEEVNTSDKRVEMTFGIGSSTSSNTRAHMSNDKKFVWEEGDQVSIFAQGHNNVPGDSFTFNKFLNNNYLHQGQFKGTTYEIDKDKYYWALYPAQSDAKLVGNTSGAFVECTIPTQQKAYNGTFDPNACIQVGTASKQSTLIQLENVCAFFYVTVGKGCTGIKITADGNEDWNMSGKVQVSASSSGASIQQFSGNNQNYVELTDIPEDGGTFYLAFVPSTHSTPSLKVSFEGIFAAEIHLQSSQQFNAGHLYYLGDFTSQYDALQQEPNKPEEEDKRVEMTFGIEANSSSASLSNTRAYMNGEKFVWNDKDQISIFAQGHDNVSGDSFTFSKYLNDNYKHQGQFNGTTYQIDKDKYYWALYPAQSDAKLVGNTSGAFVECTIPTQQKAYNGTFDPSACIQVGTASKQSTSIHLENVCAFFYVTVGKGCTGIKISAVDNEEWNMSGKVQVSASSSGASIKQFTGNNQNYVELTDIPADGGTFYLSCVPSTHKTPSLKVSFSGVYTAEIELHSNQQFNAGHLYYLGDYTDVYKKLTCYCTVEGCNCNPQSPCKHEGCYCGGGNNNSGQAPNGNDGGGDTED